MDLLQHNCKYANREGNPRPCSIRFDWYDVNIVYIVPVHV